MEQIQKELDEKAAALNGQAKSRQLPELYTPVSDDYKITPRIGQQSEQIEESSRMKNMQTFEGDLEMNEGADESNLYLQAQLEKCQHPRNNKQDSTSSTKRFKKFTKEERRKQNILYGKVKDTVITQGGGLNNASTFFASETMSQIFQKKKKPINCQQRMIVMPDSKLRQIFDLLMLFMNAYSCFSAIFYVSFGAVNQNSPQYYFDFFVEFCFLVDLVMNFFLSYTDPDTFLPVRNLGKIAKKYLCGWFLIDLVALFPFPLIFGHNGTISKLLRLLRLPRLLRLVNLGQLQRIAKILFEFSSRNDRIIAQQLCMTFLIAIVLTYFLGCIWYFISVEFNGDAHDTFKRKYIDPFNYTNWQKLTICCYFVLTTLSTVGYGDLAPQTDTERIFSLIFMIIGAGFFSIVLSDFIDIINNFDKKMGVIDKGLDLHNWLTLLSSFSGNKPLPRTLLLKIQNHFEFYWKTDRMTSLKINDPYIQALPSLVKKKIITNYLFSDIFFHFRHFFSSKEFEDSQFIYQIAFGFMPRKFQPGFIVYDEMDLVQEMYLITGGTINVGFRIAQKEKLIKRLQKDNYVGAYYCIANRPCQFLYRSFNEVNGIGIRKDYLNNIIEKYPSEGFKLKENAFYSYQNKLRVPLISAKNTEIEYYNELNPYARLGYFAKSEVIPELVRLEEEREEMEMLNPSNRRNHPNIAGNIMKTKVEKVKQEVGYLEQKMNQIEMSALNSIDNIMRALNSRNPVSSVTEH